ncbi:MAG: cupin domain-containing protein [Candidatus Eremiobacteraeota bacterium]|nr:cupin domain-containing protein [Candidatus Eremiobacteraeota bacterium]MBC5828469.1 cupin domain-containing protein [Candidatus Eremiobacteraeota bacterium]
MKHEFREDAFRWDGIEPSGYETGRQDVQGEGHRGVTRHIISGANGEPAAFSVRYFEVAPGGFTRLERHEHIHSVTVLRGRGHAIVGEDVHTIRAFDHIYVSPRTLHQFVNDSTEPLGFLCVVDALRDRPEPATSADIDSLQQNEVTAGHFRL